jgi:hypothetical protein
VKAATAALGRSIHRHPGQAKFWLRWADFMAVHQPDNSVVLENLSTSAIALGSTQDHFAEIYERLATTKRLSGSPNALAAIQRALLIQPESNVNWISLYVQLRAEISALLLEQYCAKSVQKRLSVLQRVVEIIELRSGPLMTADGLRAKHVGEQVALVQADFASLHASLISLAEEKSAALVANITALDAFVATATTQATKSRAYLLMARDLFQLGDGTQAIAAAKNAIAIQPSFTIGWQVRQHFHAHTNVGSFYQSFMRLRDSFRRLKLLYAKLWVAPRVVPSIFRSSCKLAQSSCARAN